CAATPARASWTARGSASSTTSASAARPSSASTAGPPELKARERPARGHGALPALLSLLSLRKRLRFDFSTELSVAFDVRVVAFFERVGLPVQPLFRRAHGVRFPRRARVHEG